jgi:hypothetical protein
MALKTVQYVHRLHIDQFTFDNFLKCISIFWPKRCHEIDTRRPKLFSGFDTAAPVFDGNVSFAVHGSASGSGSVEDPEFFHRKVTATKISGGDVPDLVVQLMDQVNL